MGLDFRTLLIFLGFLSFFMAAVTFALWRIYEKKFGSTRLLFFGVLLLGTGNLLIGMRAVLPQFVSIVVANGIILAGMELVLQSFRVLTGWSLQKKTVLSITVVSFAAYAAVFLIHNTLQLRFAAHIAVAAYIQLRLLLLLHRRQLAKLPALFFNRFFAWGLLLSLIARGIFAFSSDIGEEFLRMPDLHTVLFLPYLLLLVGLVFGFFLILSSRQQQQTEQLVRDKQNLIREIHHRTKNHLVIAKSLLNLEGLQSDDERIRGILNSSGGRILAIGRLHDMLYHAGDNEEIELGRYLADLGRAVLEIFSMEKRIVFEAETEDVPVPVKTASACGLILNELMTNICKYAFPAQRSGSVQLGLSRKEEGRIVFWIKDDGVGLSSENSEGSLGTQLIGAWVNQLQGRYRVENGCGVTVYVDFPLVSCK